MDQESSQHVGIKSPDIPIEGVAYVLSGWSGQGSLYQALSAIPDPDGVERAWSERAMRVRAGRILLEHLRADLDRWPRTVDEWLPALPIASRTREGIYASPRGRVDWRETSRRYGWPPSSFVTRQRERHVADVTVTTLAWTVRAVTELVEQAKRAGALGEHEPSFDEPLAAAQEALTFAAVTEDPQRPDRHDLEALRNSGTPWTDVWPVSEKIVRSETDLTWFALQLLIPDPDFRWRIYHLAALGHVLLSLRAEGAVIRWLTPLGAGGKGPNFVARTGNGTSVDVWFESAGARAYYGQGPSRYRRVAKPIVGAESAIGADIALFSSERQCALLFECKFSSYGPYVARNGYHQAAGYALNESDIWNRTWSYVLGPQEVVSEPSHVEIAGTSGDIRLGITAIPWIDRLIRSFLCD